MPRVRIHHFIRFSVHFNTNILDISRYFLSQLRFSGISRDRDGFVSSDILLRANISFFVMLTFTYHVILLYVGPSEVIKQKVQAGIYPSSMSAISSIWKEKGLIGFYEGYFGGVARDVPFRVAQLTTYELTKNLYIRIKRRRQQQKVTSGRRSKTSRISSSKDSTALTPGEAAFCGAVAGSFSAAITAPLDRIKTLLMTNSAAYGGSVISCASKIWTEEGIRGLTTGVVPRVVYIAPSVAIFFVVYEMTQQRLQHWQVATGLKSQ